MRFRGHLDYAILIGVFTAERRVCITKHHGMVVCTDTLFLCKILGFHGGDYEVSLIGCGAV
jgi:hypothetical protein